MSEVAERWRALRERSPAEPPPDLQRAPVLDNWEPRAAWGGEQIILTGTVSAGHERLRAGTVLETSVVVQVDGCIANTPAQWVRTKNTRYALGYPKTALRPLVETAMSPDWSAAAHHLVDLTGMWTADEPLATALTELGVVTGWQRRRALAHAVATSMADRGRASLHDAWLLLGLDLTGVAGPMTGHLLLDREGGELGLFSKVRDAWAAFAQRRYLPESSDVDHIAWARHIADRLVAAQAPQADPFVEAAAARTFDDAYAVVRRHVAPELAERIVPLLDMAGDDRRRGLRELRQQAEEADDGIAADLLRLLAVNPADRRDVAFVIHKLDISHGFSGGDAVLSRWMALRDAAYLETDIKDPDDPFASAVHAYANDVAGMLSAKDISDDRQSAGTNAEPQAEKPAADQPPGIVVLRQIGGTTQTQTAREVQREFKDIVGKRMPLALVPPLAPVRATLVDEFPHLTEQIDTVFAGQLEGHPLRFPPLLLAGEPGGGKTRFARRLSETLGVYMHRYDGAGSSDNAFAGTARRWSSGSHAAPLEAIRRAGVANPLLLIDEAEKGGNSRTNGSLSDALNTFLEPENSAHFNDPLVEAELDLSHVNFLLTANDEKRLPDPVRDRLTKIELPRPQIRHLPQIARSILDDIARENWLGERWTAPFEDWELAIAEDLWRGGSVRRLVRIVRAIVNQRQRSPRH